MSWKPTRSRLLIGMSVTAAIFVGVNEYRASPVEPTPSATRLQAALNEWPHAHRDTALANTAAPPADLQVDRGSEAATEESTIADYTAEKYRFLIEDLHYLDASRAGELRQLLQTRERLAGESKASGQAGESSERALAEAEGGIRGLLQAADHATYELLKDSDLELFKLNEYAGGVSNVAPLSLADREAILRTKLAYKARFRQLLSDSGLERVDLGMAEREYAYRVSSRALEDFRRDYLQEVRQYLVDDEQFALLSNYEASEFKADLARLRSMADVPLQGGS